MPKQMHARYACPAKNVPTIVRKLQFSGSFIIILFAFLGAAAGGIVVMYLHFPRGEVQMAQEELRRTIPYYDVVDQDSLVRMFWDRVQPELQCCGAVSFADWADLAEGLKVGRRVPASCCKPGRESDCTYEPDSDNAYLQVN